MDCATENEARDMFWSNGVQASFSSPFLLLQQNTPIIAVGYFAVCMGKVQNKWYTQPPKPLYNLYTYIIHKCGLRQSNIN
jgi:hypothetical protein